MPRSIAAICGVPLRKIVSRIYDDKRGVYIETLSTCGHQVQRFDHCNTTRRRCYECKRKRKRLKTGGEHD